MANSSLFLLLLLTLAPASEGHHNHYVLSEKVQVMLPDFAKDIQAHVRDMLFEIAAGFTEKFIGQAAGIMSKTSINAANEASKKIDSSKFLKTEIKNGAVLVEIDKKKMVELVSDELPAKYMKAMKKAFEVAHVAAVQGAWEQEEKLEWKYRLDDTGTRETGRLDQAKQATLPSSAEQNPLPCEQGLCVNNKLSECIRANSFTDKLFNETKTKCGCPQVKHWWFRFFRTRPATATMNQCLTNFQNSEPVSTLDCTAAVMDSTRRIIERRMAPMVCQYYRRCGGSLNDLFDCLQEPSHRTDLIQAISGPANECVQNIDEACVMTNRTVAVENFAGCILDGIRNICEEI